MLSILTFNAALLDVRIFNHSVYCPVASAPERLQRLIPALVSLRPDIIFLQEVFHRDLQQLLIERLAAEFPYVTGCSSRRSRFRLGNELLTLSRFPLTDEKLIRFQRAAPEEKIFTSKGFYHSTVMIPELGQVNLINFHATAGGVHAQPEHDRMENIRSSQIEQILSYIHALDKVLLVGDLNAGPHTSYRNYWQVLQAGYIDTFTTVGGEGYTWDPDNPLVANGGENHLPPQKIDHIFINSALSRLIMPVTATIVLTDTDNPLSDHYGMMTTFEQTG
ncbi:MAG: Endo/exonuclease/phosphatase protein [Gammaproteobacteria bacterium]|nr:Endo/exonuclease/phosphatase protein [Gammaproteobacteria bacterium]